MKIVIMGYSGAGKSTLCRFLSDTYHLPALHLDKIQFLPNWEIRNSEEQQKLVRAFLDSNPDGWVVDGNYTSLSFERRIEEADVIIQLLFGRFSCLFRCMKRRRLYKGKSRPDITAGCVEKLDWEFIKWILWEGRSKGTRERYKKIQKQNSEKVTVIRNQRELNCYLKRVCH